MARSPWDRLFLSLSEIHALTGDGLCAKCHDPIPCDTMRSLWIYDLESGGDS